MKSLITVCDFTVRFYFFEIACAGIFSITSLDAHEDDHCVGRSRIFHSFFRNLFPSTAKNRMSLLFIDPRGDDLGYHDRESAVGSRDKTSERMSILHFRVGLSEGEAITGTNMGRF